MENKNFKSVKGMFFSVRKIIALGVTGVFCYLSISGKITSTEFIPIFSMIIGYYFGKSTALDGPKSINQSDEENSNI
ncbi:hypothetical protein [Clostridium gasigenes]|uniref:hypothetical protein n=1 Tax=Clostridium gasigenes TaxID=94869 RepID=UPI001FACCA58|nr:hypothetical protein [Clostridium gasigenes]